MRDPVRIDEFCDRQMTAWKKLRDWRFGQFMMNCLGSMHAQGRDPFFPEEPEMIEFIEKYAEKYGIGD